MKTIFFPDTSVGDGGYAATIGFFDGVHRGHLFVVEQLKKVAAECGLKTMVVTFERHPRQVVQTGWQPSLLSTLDEKVSLLRETGVDVLTVLRFNMEMASMSARAFMDEVLHRKLGVELLLTGYDNRFGHDRTECFDDYLRYGRELGIDVRAAACWTADEGILPVSSSHIRQLLCEGQVKAASVCLGRPYSIEGRVVHGEQVGRKIGFPTANLQPGDDQKLIPRPGVYAVQVQVEEGPLMRGMTNVGFRPTFHGERMTLETHFLDGIGDIYDSSIRIHFIDRLRDECSFESAEALVRQIEHDRIQAEQILKTYQI